MVGTTLARVTVYQLPAIVCGNKAEAFTAAGPGWATPGALRDLFTSAALRVRNKNRQRAREGDGGGRTGNALSHGVLLARLHCCSPRVALLASHRPTRTATWARIPRRPPRRSAACRRSKHSRHGHFLFREASFAVSPSPVHALPPVTSTTPVALTVARKPADGMQAWHEGARLGRSKDAELFPRQQSSVVSCAPAAGPS